MEGMKNMKRILVDEHNDITRVAVVDDGELLEIYYETKRESSVVGNIYVGRVTKVVPNLQGCFVDIGLKRNGYLYYGKTRTVSDDCKNQNKPKVGDTLTVQVLKDAVDKKGVALTMDISVAGKFLVLLQEKGEIGVSRKITNSEERSRIKSIMEKIMPENIGVLVRTNGEGKNELEFEQDLNQMLKLMDKLEKSEFLKPPTLLLEMSNTVEKVVRDFYNNDVDQFVVTTEETFKFLQSKPEFIDKEKPELCLYNEKEPMFSHYYIQSQENKALDKRVWLKSGGFLVIEETEACVVIDVNSGKSAGKGNMEKMVLKINEEASIEVAKQLRLRNLSGIIIVDFIDMSTIEHRNIIRKTLEKAVAKDRLKTVVVGMTELGLMQITRKKTRQSLSRQMETNCLQCNARGKLPSLDWTVLHMRQEIELILANTIYKNVVVTSDERLLALCMGFEDSFRKSMLEKYEGTIECVVDNTMGFSKYLVEKG